MHLFATTTADLLLASGKMGAFKGNPDLAEATPQPASRGKTSRQALRKKTRTGL
jgi:hypothetical protein